ncbi:MAG: rhodanese-like domain-containing protein [Desulforhopalus sp.]
MYSPKAAGLAVEMGYRDVRIYRPGIIGWAKSGLQLEHNVQYPEEDVPLISSEVLAVAPKSFQIIDIRPKAHFKKGHIAGAKNIDLEELHERYAELMGVESVVLVDHKGKLTLTAGRYLISRGIKTIFRLDGGFNAWVKEGYQVSR